MAANIHRIFQQGDKRRLNFLEYCVRSVQMDPVFVFLVGEYRNGPTAAKALALYELFCETLGREDGMNKGKGGSPHISDPKSGSMLTTSIGGTSRKRGTR